MNSKQRRQHKRRAIRMASSIINISIDLLRDIESGDKTIEDAKRELVFAKREIVKL